MVIDLSAIDEWRFDGLVKGVPHGVAPLTRAAVARRGWNLLAEDIPFPACVLKTSALAHNERWMKAFLAATGAVIAPHGKTTMSPQLFARQLDAGAWAMTVATIQQVEVCRRFGIERVLLANQPVSRQGVRYLLDELARDPAFDFYCLVDSVEGVDFLARAAAARGLERPLQVLLEAGVHGARTGCRDLSSGIAVAETVHAAWPHLALRGVEGFEGVIDADDDLARERGIVEFLDFLAALACECARAGLFADGTVILSAGGSTCYDLVTDRLGAVELGREKLLVLRSGCYLSHDSAMYERAVARLRERSPLARELGEPPRAALELWAHVQSRPEPGRVIVAFGKRDCSHDAGPPRALAWYRPDLHEAPQAMEGHCEVVALNDQHALLTVASDSPLRFGDLVAFGISHPCTTFDKWPLVYLVDDDYRISDAIRTYF